MKIQDFQQRKLMLISKKGYSLNDQWGLLSWKQYRETLQRKTLIKEIHLDKYGNMEEAWIQLRKVVRKQYQADHWFGLQDSVDALLKGYFNFRARKWWSQVFWGCVCSCSKSKNRCCVIHVESQTWPEHRRVNTGQELWPLYPGSVVKAACISSGWEKMVFYQSPSLNRSALLFSRSFSSNLFLV